MAYLGCWWEVAWRLTHSALATASRCSPSAAHTHRIRPLLSCVSGATLQAACWSSSSRRVELSVRTAVDELFEDDDSAGVQAAAQDVKDAAGTCVEATLDVQEGDGRVPGM